MFLDLKGKIKRALIEAEDNEFIHNKTITIYNYKGIPHNEGAVLHYMCPSWDFLTTLLVSHQDTIATIQVKYKDIHEKMAKMRIGIISTSDDIHEYIHCTISKDNSSRERIKIDDCSHCNGILATLFTSWKEKGFEDGRLCWCTDHQFNVNLTKLLPEDFWKEVYNTVTGTR